MTFEILAGALKVQQLSEALLATAGRKIKFDYWLAKTTQRLRFIDKKGRDVTPTNVVRTLRSGPEGGSHQGSLESIRRRIATGR